MGTLLNLSAFVLRQLAEAVGFKGGEQAVAFLHERFEAHHELLLDALGHANERAWDVLEFSLAGDSLWNRVPRGTVREEAKGNLDVWQGGEGYPPHPVMRVRGGVRWGVSLPGTWPARRKNWGVECYS